MAHNEIWSKKVFNAEAIAKSEIAFSNAIKLRERSPEGYFRLQLALTGSGTCKLEWLVSADGYNYLVPTGYDNVICSDFTKSSGSHSIEYADQVLIRDVAGMTEINGQTATVASTTATTFTTDIDSSGYTTYTSGGSGRVLGKEVFADVVITAISKADPAVVTVDKGRDIFRMTVPPMPYFKIKATETGGSSAIAISAWLVIV